MNKVNKIGWVLVLTILIILVRFFEGELFYDPLFSYFKSDYSNLPIPEMNSIKFIGNIVLRFFINTCISLAIIWVIFNDKEIIKLSSIIYIAFFIILFCTLIYLLFFSETKNVFAIFYVRRFLIHPILLLVLIPAFYFQKNN